MQSKYSKPDLLRVIQTLESVEETLFQLVEWNQHIKSSDDYYSSQQGMQLLAANCTLITAIGEGINRINRIAPGFLAETCPDIPWRDIIGMRNHIAHGYFELDAEIIYQSISHDLVPLGHAIENAIRRINKENKY